MPTSLEGCNCTGVSECNEKYTLSNVVFEELLQRVLLYAVVVAVFFSLSYCVVCNESNFLFLAMCESIWSKETVNWADIIYNKKNFFSSCVADSCYCYHYVKVHFQTRPRTLITYIHKTNNEFLPYIALVAMNSHSTLF